MVLRLGTAQGTLCPAPPTWPRAHCRLKLGMRVGAGLGGMELQDQQQTALCWQCQPALQGEQGDRGGPGLREGSAARLHVTATACSVLAALPPQRDPNSLPAPPAPVPCSSLGTLRVEALLCCVLGQHLLTLRAPVLQMLLGDD